MTDRAYLDHAATTPLRPEAREVLVALLDEEAGNPSGTHRAARTARRVVDEARDVVAAALGCRPGEVVFTSGGTESDNLAVAGVHAAQPGVVVCSAIEHHAVLDPVEALGGRVVGVDARGRVDLDALAASLDGSVVLVSVMLANNEIGVVQDLAAVAAVVQEHAPGAVVHTDAVQAFPWLDVAELAAPAHLVSISAHKFGGPQGVGALVVRTGTPLTPLQRGGGQERGRRSGTQNVAGIGAMAAAAAATLRDRDEVVHRVARLRDRLGDALTARLDGVTETAVPLDADGRPDRSGKVAGSCHVCIDGVENEALLFLLDQQGVAASAASSCASGAMDPSHVLAALGVPRERAQGSLRLTLGPTTTEAEVDHAVEVVVRAVERLRGHRR
ncbi:cysteine desulfurase family protein [Actinomarinicola tropica]|uniref:Aminotransferase class V-fold PLP-dependent enzyme n=1 Tax=Actinomarinicola tropica TaxID=2789776 RepID=A0A5Q2RG54_9ACTN|nr:cysteine desulfurase family protein [Actinomarinicola tropica]QGG94624.1 aminotransferase class V-fold PLP-dependent enzyme [Actinomarinicola tropica]